MKNEVKVVDLKSMDFMGVNSLDGKIVTVSTREIANRFDKRHDDLIAMVERRIKSIETLGESETDSFGLNFIPSKYKSRGKEFKQYLLTKDGFIFVVMGLEGLEAEKLKIKYINTFNKMLELIQTRQLTKIGYKDMSRAVKDYYERKEREAQYYHYVREADMINVIVLGMTAQNFKSTYGAEREDVTRDIVPEWKLKIIDRLERLNTELIDMDMSFDERKRLLERRYFKEIENKILIRVD